MPDDSKALTWKCACCGHVYVLDAPIPHHQCEKCVKGCHRTHCTGEDVFPVFDGLWPKEPPKDRAYHL